MPFVFVALFDQYIDTNIHEEDRELLREVSRLDYIRERLKRDKHYSIEIRDLATGKERWMQLLALPS